MFNLPLMTLETQRTQNSFLRTRKEELSIYPKTIDTKDPTQTFTNIVKIITIKITIAIESVVTSFPEINFPTSPPRIRFIIPMTF